MALTTKDAVGIVMVVGTAGALLIHNGPTDHRRTHVKPVADAGGAVTSAATAEYGSARPASDASTVAFVDVNVVPMDREGVLPRQVVVVRDGFVTEMGPVGAVEPPSGAFVVDGGGTRYLAPGLTDAHVHLGDEAEELLPLFLANGVTTVFNLEGDERHLALRARVLGGDVPGPTIYTSGPFVDEQAIRSPADARRIVRQQDSKGYDFVKLHGDLGLESFAALTRSGDEAGISVVGHAPRNLPFSAVLENGQAAVSHAEELIYTEFMSLDEARLPGVADRMAGAGTWLTPGLAHFENLTRQWGEPTALGTLFERPGATFLPPGMRRRWEASREYVGQDPAGRPRIEDMRAFHDPLVLTFHRAGVPMLAGTDAGIPGMVPGFSLHEEMAALGDAGLSTVDVLRTATTNAGRFISEHVDASARFGTVAVESRADLLLLEADPRARLEVLRHPLGVMVRGRWYGRADLNRMIAGASAGR